jgi:hypothetical protein
MRALLATSLGVLSTATLLLQPAAAAAVSGAFQASGSAHKNESPAASPHRMPGTTQSLPLERIGPVEGAVGTTGAGRSERAPQPGRTVGLEQRTVQPFSLVGVVWADANQRLDADVQVRTRRAVDGSWTAWRSLTAHSEHAPGPLSRTGADGPVRGSTPPLWVGPSDGVQVRVHAKHGPLPRGLRLELVAPGEAPERGPAGRAGAAAPGGPQGPDRNRPTRGADAMEPPAMLPELSEEETVDEAEQQGFEPGVAEADGKPHVGPRPGIVTRGGWGADADLREGGFAYGDAVRMAFVHHTAGSNGYSCKEAPKVIRSIYRYHVKSLGWRDIGYNFLIDKCGTIYEGRAGGVTESVRGAHTLGFNNASMGVAVLGNFSKKNPPKKATDAIAKLAAWKLGLYGVNAAGTTRMTSGGGKYSKGSKVKMDTISGHRDGFSTECPGKQLYDELGDVRKLAARLQGRR